MGDNFRRFTRIGKGKFETGQKSELSRKREKAFSLAEIFFWIFIISLTVSFFIHSWNGRAARWSLIVFESLLLTFSLVSAYFALKDKKINVLNQKRKANLKLLFRQKEILGDRFDLKKKLGDLPLSGDSEFLNLAKSNYSKKSEKKNDAIEEMSIPSEVEAEQVVISEVNLADKLIQGEDISAFSPDWRRFFAENEDKTTVEKLNLLFCETESKKEEVKK